MIERIRTRYSLSYHAPGGAPGSFCKVTVRLIGEGYKKYPWRTCGADGVTTWSSRLR